MMEAKGCCFGQSASGMARLTTSFVDHRATGIW